MSKTLIHEGKELWAQNRFYDRVYQHVKVSYRTFINYRQKGIFKEDYMPYNSILNRYFPYYDPKRVLEVSKLIRTELRKRKNI